MELIIATAVIGIIAGIAIPILISSRRAANEASAQSSLRTIHSAQAVFQATAGNGTFGNLAELFGQNLIDPALGAGTKSGYDFLCPDANIVDGPPATFFATASPSNVAPVTRTGNRSFAISEDGVLRGLVGDAPPATRAAVGSVEPVWNHARPAQQASYSVSGNLYHYNGNGAYDPFPFLVVELLNADGEPIAAMQSQDGSYSFQVLQGQSYDVRVVHEGYNFLTSPPWQRALENVQGDVPCVSVFGAPSSWFPGSLQECDDGRTSSSNAICWKDLTAVVNASDGTSATSKPWRFTFTPRMCAPTPTPTPTPSATATPTPEPTPRPKPCSPGRRKKGLC